MVRKGNQKKKKNMVFRWQKHKNQYKTSTIRKGKKKDDLQKIDEYSYIWS